MDNWKISWQPMIESVGKNFHDNQKEWGADPIEEGAIRRFLEPLQFDCALHTDEKVAQQNGYETIVAPNSSLLTWLIPPYWEPGQDVFSSANLHQPVTEKPLLVFEAEIAPRTPYYFATNMDIDYVQPFYVGDRLCRTAIILKSCIPKETKVGKGAFITWESRIENQKEELIALLRLETYHYFPHNSKEVSE